MNGNATTMQLRDRTTATPSTPRRQFLAYAAPWESMPDDGLPHHDESRHG
jgi:hypothetical protein